MQCRKFRRGSETAAEPNTKDLLKCIADYLEETAFGKSKPLREQTLPHHWMPRRFLPTIVVGANDSDSHFVIEVACLSLAATPSCVHVAHPANN